MGEDPVAKWKHQAGLPATASFRELLLCINIGRKATGAPLSLPNISEALSDLLQSPLADDDWKVRKQMQLTSARPVVEDNLCSPSTTPHMHSGILGGANATDVAKMHQAMPAATHVCPEKQHHTGTPTHCHPA
jgi:hypothetical protein